MYFIGIDIGKNHHEASIVSDTGKQIGRSLRFASTHKGADSLMEFIFRHIGDSLVSSVWKLPDITGIPFILFSKPKVIPSM